MPNDAGRLASSIAEARMCSVEMPAGTGKTETIASLVGLLVNDGKRVLVLTHTNAGVAALRRRLSARGLLLGGVSVSTICSWAEAAALAYPASSGVSPTLLETGKLTDYYESCVSSATTLLGLDYFASVVRASYDAILVDEYQDCSLVQHELMLALREAVPLVYVFGDRLQRIFDFKGVVFPSWDEVEASFGRLDPGEVVPHRWAKRNAVLGDWLLNDVRPRLLAGQDVDYFSAPTGSLTIVARRRGRDPYADTVSQAFDMVKRAGSKLVLCDSRKRGERVAIGGRLAGLYGVMENQEGTEIAKELQAFLRTQGPTGRACWLAKFAKKCFSNWGKCLDQTVMRALESGKNLARYENSRQGYENVLRGLQGYAAAPSAATFRAACLAIEGCPATNLHSKDMWRDGTHALQRYHEGGADLIEALVELREAKKFASREQSSALATTLLVKGLEFNHVLIHNLANLENEKHVYVALTRASDTLTIIL